MADISVRHSKKFDVDIIDGQFDIAIDYYLDWCEENKVTPEFSIDSCMDDLSDLEFESVLLYANIQGLQLNT